MATLSVIIITHNEAAAIRDCLESVKWADEIIVIDSASTDDTVQICKEYTEKVYNTTDWPGFGKQKQRALEKATQQWVLNLDADERLSPALQTEIQSIIQQPNDCVGYYLPIQLVFYNRIIKYANGSLYHLRLIKKGCAQYNCNEKIHESLQVNGQTKKLKQPIYHYSVNNISELLSKMNYYSSLGAQKRHQHGKRASVSKAFLRGCWMFLRVFFLQLGFLDGKRGFILAIAFAEGSYYSYLKIVFPDQP